MLSSIGFKEILIVLVILLLLFGHKKIKGFGKALGEGLRDFKKGLEGKTDTTESAFSSTDNNTTKATTASTDNSTTESTTAPTDNSTTKSASSSTDNSTQ